MRKRKRYVITCNGQEVASVEGGDQALAEAFRYAMQYREEGSVIVTDGDGEVLLMATKCPRSPNEG